MPTSNDFLQAAANELGYSRWDDSEAGTKYGRWYADMTGESYYGESGVPFCAMFVSYCANEVGLNMPGLPGAYVPYILNACRDAGILVNNEDAQPGDPIMFDWNGDGTPDHIGICEVNHPDERYMETIEGNTNNGQVARRTRSYDYIIGCARPSWDDSQPQQNDNPPAQDETPVDGSISEDGYAGSDTIRLAQEEAQAAGYDIVVDGCISGQVDWILNQPGIQDLNSDAWTGGADGSLLVQAIQHVLGVYEDGFFGPDTWHNLEIREGTMLDNTIDSPSTTIQMWQHELNQHSFF